ncbi:invasion associated locus B family protein [Acidisphaera sp. S103]|uniref:invasion associated locus B family protein n=1 Tax=Acidisphaera sp. S103 TaxID=1747223 RepID=UPI0020B10CD1|nr:invasion associated locus B family protein [Acidisphaera sp. S103]
MTESRLFGARGGPIAAGMNTPFRCFLTFALLLALPAVAAPKKTVPAAHPAATAGPKPIGKFEDWTAATHTEAGQTVCYAFTRVQSSAPVLPGRGAVVLTVTERSSGRDAVAIEAGFAYAPNATVTVQVDQTGLEFYTAARDAFARDGKAAVAAFQRGSRAIARSPGSKEVTDTFSLKGFGAAYAAIAKACPAK